MKQSEYKFECRVDVGACKLTQDAVPPFGAVFAEANPVDGFAVKTLNSTRTGLLTFAATPTLRTR